MTGEFLTSSSALLHTYGFLVLAVRNSIWNKISDYSLGVTTISSALSGSRKL